MISRAGKSTKKVVFHIGFPKTGSSALQTFLSANAAAFEASGVSYPYPEPESVTATGASVGNLIQIMYQDGFVERYQASTGRRTETQRILDRNYFERIASLIEGSNHSTIIFSGEAFSSAPLDALISFKDRIFDCHDVTLIGFVRDPFESFYSAWRQCIKTQKTSLEFGDFVTKRVKGQSAIHMLDGYARLRKVGLDPVLINYDSCKSDIVGKFLEVAGIELPQAATYRLSGNHYNSSLTGAEAALLQMVNARFPMGDFPATLSKLLLRRPASLRGGDDFYSAEIDRQILSAYRPQIAEMNETIIGDKLRTSVRSRPDSSPMPGEREIACLLEAVEISWKAKSEVAVRPSVFSRLKDFLRRPGLPAGFDPKAYLFHNEDVATAGIDPGWHYRRFGRVEERRYRFS